MAFKFVAFASLVVAASAGILRPNPVVYNIAQFSTHLSQSHPAPAAYAAPKAQAWPAASTTEAYHPEPKYEDSYNYHPKYNYAYDVHDSHTGDLKNQQESRDGDVVKGSYSLIEADGSRRVVHYSADDHHGFNAIVEKQAAKAAPAVAAWTQVASTTEAYHPEPKYEESYNHHPQYNYAYDVHDSHTGDLKNQQESRDGDVVKGSYSLIEADGSRRVVHYSADDHHGFNAIVEKQAAKAAPAVAAWTHVASTTEAYHPEPKYEESYNHHPQYNYAYDVHDSHTGDLKNQQESRDGDVVKGSYSLIEADGSRRVVHYSADDHHGFNAIVEKQAAKAAPAVAAWTHVVSTTEAYHPEPKYEESYNHHPQYNYAYDVHDSHTGDLKNQQESRDGDVVKGSYSLIEADGSRRVVHYSADDHHGFNAVVEKQPAQAVPTTAAPEHVGKVQHVAYVTPIVYQQVAPVAHYSQSVSYSHAAAPQHYHY